MLDYWIDCLAFDMARSDLSGRNLTPQGVGMVNVFPLSPLAEYMDHNKGQGHDKYGRENEPLRDTA